ncbi:hypothetical protein AVEN_193852-1 [Araneus ventricosus]|uniref:Uncharacterized protein n=1 Tax=Araneus ventricosus TaxID=182803 RepID=A0A4Y2I140_ARAVE|nr:hypothetical protein AVEN_193852-1 [Araneus ventricosus]
MLLYPPLIFALQRWNIDFKNKSYIVRPIRFYEERLNQLLNENPSKMNTELAEMMDCDKSRCCTVFTQWARVRKSVLGWLVGILRRKGQVWPCCIKLGAWVLCAKTTKIKALQSPPVCDRKVTMRRL